MPIVASDPLTWAMSSLGWAFIGVIFILLGVPIAKLAGNLLGRPVGQRWRPLVITELLYVVVVSVASAIAYIGTQPYWIGIAITYLPVPIAPLVALLGSVTWSHGVRTRQESR